MSNSGNKFVKRYEVNVSGWQVNSYYKEENYYFDVLATQQDHDAIEHGPDTPSVMDDLVSELWEGDTYQTAAIKTESEDIDIHGVFSLCSVPASLLKGTRVDTIEV